MDVQLSLFSKSEQVSSGLPKQKLKSTCKLRSGALHNESNIKVALIERQQPYAWVTRIAKLMAGDNQCKYSAWFPTRYQYEKLPSGFCSEKMAV